MRGQERDWHQVIVAQTRLPGDLHLQRWYCLGKARQAGHHSLEGRQKMTRPAAETGQQSRFLFFVGWLAENPGCRVRQSVTRLALAVLQTASGLRKGQDCRSLVWPLEQDSLSRVVAPLG